MLAEPNKGVPIETLAGTHMFDVKLDGVRSVATWDGMGGLTLSNRVGRDQTASYPDLVTNCPLTDTLLILDGEIVSRTGSFEEAAKRDKQTKPADVARTAAQIPVQFLAFDLLQMGDLDLRSWPWHKRRIMLEAMLAGVANTHWGLTVVSGDPALLDHVAKLGMEGVIAKRADAPYRAGRHADWLKYKITHRVTCIAVGYEPGEGSRAHFGAMHLAMIGADGKPVPVGRVGTGFDTDATYDCKARLDAGQIFLAEIELANVTKDGKLRFPVFKGIRTDVPITAAMLSQLDTIPRS